MSVNVSLPTDPGPPSMGLFPNDPLMSTPDLSFPMVPNYWNDLNALAGGPGSGITPGSPMPAYNPPDLNPPGAQLGPYGSPSWENNRSNWYGPGAGNLSIFPTTWVYRDTPAGAQWVPRPASASMDDIANAIASGNAGSTGTSWYNNAPSGSVTPQANPADAAQNMNMFWSILGINRNNI